MNMMNEGRLRSFALLILLMLPVNFMSAAPKAVLWDRWLPHDSDSARIVDHSLWDEFLQTYMLSDDPSGVNLLRYGEVTPEDRKVLNSYISLLESENVDTLNRNEQLAFWINLYNAVTVKTILDHYPVKSIRDIDISGFLRNGPWDADLTQVMGVDLTLNDIEHRIIRPIWPGPLPHYVVNCASYSCPDLAERAFTGSNVLNMMEDAARRYVNHPRGVEMDGNAMRLSSIYKWYGKDDFGGDRQGLMDHLKSYAEGKLADDLSAFQGKISYSYDWTLNEPGRF